MPNVDGWPWRWYQHYQSQPVPAEHLHMHTQQPFSFKSFLPSSEGTTAKNFLITSHLWREQQKRCTYWKIKRAEDNFVAFYLGESLEGSQDRVKKLSQLSVNVKRHHPRPNQENLHPLSCCSQIANCKCSHSCMQSKDHTIWVGI